MRQKLVVLAVAAVGLVAATAPAGAAELVVNGGFETGNFEGWTHEDEGSGDWFVYSGDVGPEAEDTYGGDSSGESGNTIAPPPEGAFAATTDQSGPGSHILYQDVALPVDQACSLGLIAYYTTQASTFATPDTLDYTVIPNQQYRIDVMDPTAPVDSVDAGILLTLLHTQVGDPLTLDPTTLSADLTPYAGQTIRLRFAEVDNSENFEASVDAVSVDCTTPAPEPLVLLPSFTG